MGKYKVLKSKEFDDAELKIQRIKEKELMKRANKALPGQTVPLLSAVNVFSEAATELVQESPKDPWICDDFLTFNDCEMQLLARGPKFMVREELDAEEFTVEVEKMIAKEKFNDTYDGKDDCGPTVSDVRAQPEPVLTDQPSVRGTNSVNEVSDVNNIDMLWEANAGSMVFNLKTKQLDLGNLRATNYKHNKLTYMPKAGNIKREIGHERRKDEMKSIYDKVAKGLSNDKFPDRVKQKVSTGGSNSHFSKNELKGLKSLKKRIKAGELVICDTDKSKCFCALTREQYFSSGLVHTSKDLEISHHQVKRIQNTVNDHIKWLSEIFECGSNCNPQDRMKINLSDGGEQVCSMTLI